MLELRPARLQLVIVTLTPLAILGAFTASCWFLVAGVWGRVLAAVFAAFGLWWAQAGFWQMRRTRVCADAEGVSLTDGSRRGYADQAARWDDVASCTVEKRASSPDEVGTPHLVLKNAVGADLFTLYLRFLFRNDTARLLRFVESELRPRNASFEVPAQWYER